MSYIDYYLICIINFFFCSLYFAYKVYYTFCMHNVPNWLNFLKEGNEKRIFKQDDQKLGKCHISGWSSFNAL